jgi:RNA polymerase sigma-70 factor (ECF subfamily)
MSTTSYDTNDSSPAEARFLRNNRSAAVGSQAGDFMGLQPLPRPNPRETRYGSSDSDASEDDLISAAQRGDQKAFVELCRRHSTVTKKKIFSIVRNHEDAEDALQDTLLRAYTHFASFRGSCRFSTWLTAIGVNSALTILRKRRGRREAYASPHSLDIGVTELREAVDGSPSPEVIYLKEQATLLVTRAVERLRPNLRSVVCHYYGSDCSLKEAAKASGISLGAAKSRLLRGRVRLRTSLARYGISKSRS